MDDDFAAMMGFAGFGKKAPVKKTAVTTEKLDKTKRAVGPSAPAPPPPSSASSSKPVEDSKPSPSASTSTLPAQPEASSSTSSAPPPPTTTAPEEDTDSDFEDDEDEQDFLPSTHEITWKDHSKPVSALALDPSGARVATGSHDYDIKMYDFGGMTAGEGGYKPFASWEPTGSYHIHNLEYSPNGEKLLVISGTTQAQVYDREGEPRDGRGTKYMKGDPYIRDMKHTAGHVAELTSGGWNPKNTAEFVTASNDSTVRIWDVENLRKQKVVISVKSKDRGTRTKVTACAYSPDGKTIGAAGLDGTFHIWSTSGNFARPSMSNETAHTKGAETSSVCFSIDGRTVLTRGGDDTVKLWDMRSFKTPLFTASNLPNLYPETNVIFSPDDRHILTGVGKRPGGEKKSGEMVVLAKEGLEVERRVDVGEGSVIRVAWHSRINQIVTTSSTGLVSVLYNPYVSSHGALLPLAKMGRTAPRNIDQIRDTNIAPIIMTPHALPMFKDAERVGVAGGKRRREKDRNDAVKTMKPTVPVNGVGSGGRVGASAQQHLLRAVIKDNTMGEDPREALLKYASDAALNPVWAGAWADQPKIFRNIEDEIGGGEEDGQGSGSRTQQQKNKKPRTGD